jgi:hypothetical protein
MSPPSRRRSVSSDQPSENRRSAVQPRPVSWTTINPGGSRMQCNRCGRTYALVYPIETWALVALGEGFAKEHAKCVEPTDGPRCRVCLQLGHPPEECPGLYAATPEQWLNGPDTGLSSLTIYGVMHNESAARAAQAGFGAGQTPSDGDDFGRCYRLVALFPSWRARMGEVAARYPQWGPFVQAWDELSALYEQPGGSDALYRRMREIDKGLRGG